MLGITDIAASHQGGMEGVEGRAPRGCFFGMLLLCLLFAAAFVFVMYLATSDV